ncbi:MAG: hypothetical protein WEB67_03055 [Acidimicrobiia bacterium]
MERVEEINHRLGEIQDELSKLDAEDFAAKNQLHVERDRLRDEAKSHQQDRDAARPSSELIQELKQRYGQLDSISKQHINPAKATDGGFGGAGAYNGPADAQAINRSIDQGTGRAKVELRINHLESILKERGHL